MLALAAMHVGIPYAPVAPAYSLLSQDHRTLAAVCAAMQPGLVFADDGPRFAKALTSLALGPDVEIVTCTPIRRIDRSTRRPSQRSANRRRPRRWTMPTRA